MRWNISARSASARATCAPVSARPTRVFHTIVSLSVVADLEQVAEGAREADAAQDLEGLVGAA